MVQALIKYQEKSSQENTIQTNPDINGIEHQKFIKANMYYFQKMSQIQAE